MPNTITRQIILIALAMNQRVTQFHRERERGDENVTKVFYVVLAVTLGTLIGAAVTAFVNGKLPLIGGH